MHSSSTLLLGVASAAFVGMTLGVLVGHAVVSTRPAAARRYGLLAYLRCLSCGRRRRSRFPKRLILVRHGQSEGNIDPLLYCHVPDNAMHLTALGLEQAVAAGKSIKKIIGDETVRFIVSPYVRTIETFQGITKAWGDDAAHIPWTEEPRIREQDFGNFQEPNRIRECKSQRRRFGAFFYRFPSGESPADVYDRISSFLESLYRMFDKMSEQNYVLVTHGVAIRVILTRYFKYRVSEFEQLENFHNGEVAVLELDERHMRYNLAKIVTNTVELHDDGSVDVETHESESLRVRTSPALCPMFEPYPTSPMHQYRRVSAALLPELTPQDEYERMQPVSCASSMTSSNPEELELNERVPIAMHADNGRHHHHHHHDL
ncbi:hypothetical protein ATCC90586_007906 [Pythium insidiosum]|nr:hypothetical protein ATCC90586_007906 [Pythium insidiosum]